MRKPSLDLFQPSLFFFFFGRYVRTRVVVASGSIDDSAGATTYAFVISLEALRVSGK